MQNNQSEQIRECCRHAEDCSQKAVTACLPTCRDDRRADPSGGASTNTRMVRSPCVCAKWIRVQRLEQREEIRFPTARPTAPFSASAHGKFDILVKWNGHVSTGG
jgi:hypothetical protein